MTKDEMKNRISMALKDPILQQGFEIICKENAELKMALKRGADNRDKLLKENARMRSMLKTLNASIVMTADDVFWSLKDDVKKFLQEIKKC